MQLREAELAFAVLADRPRYVPDGPARLQGSLRQRPQCATVVITRDDVIVTSADAETMSAAQWTVVNELQALLPKATIVIRVHKVTWKCDTETGLPPVFGILVTQRVGPFTLRREYAASEGLAS